MSGPWIKICGITTPEAVSAVGYIPLPADRQEATRSAAAA